MTISTIDVFEVGDKAYYHNFDVADDSVHLHGEDDQELIIYTRNCHMKKPDTGETIGHFSLTDRSWVFRWNDPGNDRVVLRSKNTHDLLEFEVEVSKYYLEHLYDKEIQTDGVS